MLAGGPCSFKTYSRFMDLPGDSTDCSCSGRVCCVPSGLNGLDVNAAPRLWMCVYEREREREVSQCRPRLLNIDAIDTQRQIRPCALHALSQHPCPLPGRRQKHLPHSLHTQVTCDNQNCLQILSHVPWRIQSLLVETRCPRLTIRWPALSLSEWL